MGAGGGGAAACTKVITCTNPHQVEMRDEDAFAIMGGLGGVGIIVSETARETSARYGLRNPAEVVQFLEHFIGDDRAESTHASSVGDFAPIRAPPAQISRPASATTINAREFVS